MSRYPQYNVNNEHQLISRQNTYVLDRKLVTVHSEDRDTNKWPNVNHFEVELPQTLTNVQSMRLVEIGLPSTRYVFSNNHQNTKLAFYLIPNSSLNTNEFNILLANVSHLYTITIQEGFYKSNEIANEIQNLMNKAVTNLLKDNGSSFVYNNFKVYYDKVSQKLFFGNNFDRFTLAFDEKLNYNVDCAFMNDENPDVWNLNINWGLPSYLGFNKEYYQSIDSSSNISFEYDNNEWLVHDNTYSLSGGLTDVYYVVAPFNLNIKGDEVIYMELDKYNSMDEIRPFVQDTNNLYNNDYNGRVNSAFAKIPITVDPNGTVFDSRNDLLQNVSQYQPPIDKIRKIKVKFRYHDGRLVDFKRNNLNFTISFCQLRDEIQRNYTIRVPAEYIL